MRNTIHPDHLFGYFSRGPWITDALGPFLVAHAQHAQRSDARWPWTRRAAVEPLLDEAWAMLGRWQARRAVAVKRSRFDREAVAPIQRLARVLNEHEVGDLHELAIRRDASVRAVSRAVLDAVESVSRIKPTSALKPMFGSKVLHHYFPSVVPVFDDAVIRKRLMPSRDFRAFEDLPDERWATHVRGSRGCEGELDEYARYFTYLVARVGGLSSRSLRRVRVAFGEAIRTPLPPEVVKAKGGLLWRLDAKVAEFCACGAARR